jgi:small GTP-binding protein
MVRVTISGYVHGHPTDIEIWDTPGQDAFAGLVPEYTRDAKVVILAFSLTDADSLNMIVTWLDRVNTHENIPIIYIVGNKSDLPRVVTLEDVMFLGISVNAPYVETSAKTGSGIEELLECLMGDVSGLAPSPRLLEARQNP